MNHIPPPRSSERAANAVMPASTGASFSEPSKTGWILALAFLDIMMGLVVLGTAWALVQLWSFL